MRTVRLSSTARAMFKTLLAQGAAKFGIDVAEAKGLLVEDCIRNYLAEFPHLGLRTPRKPFFHYPVSNTPFTVIYQYDDAELRVLFIVHNRANRRNLKPADVEW
jgi:plasmid stabilization system protein ParE